VQPTQTDIIIIGGGIVGLTAACALAQHDFTVALVGNEPLNTEHKEELNDQRISAISLASKNILQNLMVWDRIPDKHISAYKAMTVWDAVGKGRIQFDSSLIGEHQLGFMIPNDAISVALSQRLEEFTNIKTFTPTKPTKMLKDDSGVTLELENGETIKGKLIIGADGGRSWLRNELRIPTQDYDYEQHALVTTVKTQKTHQKTAWQRFLPNGPLAFLPMNDQHTSSIVWSTTPEEAAELKDLNEKDFHERLSNAFDLKLGD